MLAISAVAAFIFFFFSCGYKQRVPVRKRRAGAALRADVSPASTLEVLAHLAQGDIPLLSAARTRRRVSPHSLAAVRRKAELLFQRLARVVGGKK